VVNNKIVVSLFLGILLIGCVCLYFFNQPTTTYVFENIPPQIICYGGGC